MAITVNYSEMQGSPKESKNRAGVNTAIRTLECNWGDRWTLMSEIQNEDYENQSGTLMVAISAASAPLLAANTGSLTIAAYQKAIVTVTYQILTFESDPGGTNIRESIEPTAEFLSVDGTELRWTNNSGDQVGTGDYPSKLFVGFDYVINKENIIDIPATVLTLIGKVNAKAVSPTSEGLNHLTFPAQTLLYQPPSIVRTFNEDGDPAWNISYRLTYKPNIDKTGTKRGWNYFFRTEKGAGGQGDFDKMFIADGNQYVPYETGDFTTI